MDDLKDFTLRDVLERSARLFAARAAVSFAGSDGYSYAELLSASARLAGRLESMGVRQGDRVVLLSENRPEWCVAYFAVTAMGAVAVPVLTDFHTDEILHIISHSEARMIIVSSKMYEKISAGALSAKMMRMETFEEIPAGGIPSEAGNGAARIGIVAAGDASFDRFPRPSPGDIASIIYTSGTTGTSKGVMLTHDNIVFDAVATLKRVRVTENDVLLSILPLAHTYECTLGFVTPIIAGASVRYLDKPPVASVLIPALSIVRPTMMLSVPLVIEKIYKSKVLPSLTEKPIVKFLFSLPPGRVLLSRVAGKKLLATFGKRLKFFGIGGSKLDPVVERFLRDAGFPYAIGYGLTETSPLIAGTDASRTRYQSTGPVLDGVEFRIADPDPATGEGEIQVRGRNVMKGYYKDAEKTREAFTEDGWLKTGDLGILDDKSYVYIRGRIKNMILGPSGENIYPEDIEATINGFPEVHESLVVQMEGKLVAFIRFNYEEITKRIKDIGDGLLEKQKQGMDYLNDLRKQVNAKLNSFSRISGIREQHEPFEKTPTNKIKRFRHIARND